MGEAQRRRQQQMATASTVVWVRMRAVVERWLVRFWRWF
jgi:hypothetical protein